MDVYSEWVDACDAVAKDTADPTGDDDGITSYYELAAGNGRRNSGMQLDRHLVAAVEGDDDDQGDYQ